MLMVLVDVVEASVLCT